MNKLTYEEAAKRVRNLLRPYSAESVVLLALEQTNNSRNANMLDQLQALPWITLLIVKLVLEDQMIHIDIGNQCPQNVFDHCRQTLWNADGLVPESGDAKGNAYLMIRSLMNVQLSFQKKISWDFVRWPALIARLSSDHPTRTQFVERLGMEPDVFICLCFAAYIPVLKEDMTFKREYFDSLRKCFGTGVDRFLNEFTRDIHGLRAELRRQLKARITAKKPARIRQELIEFPWLANYPLLQLRDQQLIVWHPIVFARGFESAVHKRLSERRENYATHFSKVFENYVLELITEAGLTYLDEQTYKDGVGASNNAVEAIYSSADTNVFIEAKMTAYSDDLILSDRAPVVWRNLKRVREAMNQGWIVCSRLCAGNTPNLNCTHAKENFLIIVTSQQISCATGEHFRRLFKHDIFDPVRLASNKIKAPTVNQLAGLPLNNIIIVSIEEFEHMMGCILNGEIELVAFLREVATANADPQTSVMFIDQLLGPKTKKWGLTGVLKHAIQNAEETLTGALSS